MRGACIRTLLTGPAESSAISASCSTAFYSAENYPDHLRRIRFNDPETGNALVFLTNNTTLPA